MAEEGERRKSDKIRHDTPSQLGFDGLLMTVSRVLKESGEAKLWLIIWRCELNKYQSRNIGIFPLQAVNI